MTENKGSGGRPETSLRPVFYQRGFANEGGLLWRYDRRKHEYKPLPPKVVCREKDLYALQKSDGSWDMRIETHVLSPIESKAAEIIRALTPGVVPNRNQQRQLTRFIAVQHTRLPSFGIALRTVTASLGDEWARLRFGTEQRAQDALTQLREKGEAVEISAESMVDAVLNGRIKAYASERVFIEYMFKAAEFLGAFLEESDWTVLVAPRTSSFIVCDDPFVLVPPQGVDYTGIGFGLPGVTCYFPLTSKLCLKTVHGGYSFRYERIDSRAVRTINHNIAAHSERFVMASTQAHLEAVIRGSKSTDMEPHDRYFVDTIRPDEDNAYTVFQRRPARYFYI